MKRSHLIAPLLLSYLAILVVLLFFHEPWRDELQCWTIAKESSSFFDLLHKARYEGHPSAWYAVLYVITRVTDSFLAVRLLHIVLMAAAMFLLLFKSPYSTTTKSLLAFGYFFVYEYGALTRIYALGILILFLVCALIDKRDKHWWLICVLLVLAMQVSVFGVLLAMALCVPLFWGDSSVLGKKKVGGLVLVGAGLALSGYDMMPPADSTFASGWKWAAPEWREALSSFFHSMVPIPEPGVHFWNSNLSQAVLAEGWLRAVEPIIAVAVLLGCLLSLRRHPAALAFFATAWIAITCFLSVKYAGFLRHHGHYFLAYVMALWIAQQGRRTNGRPVILYALLSLHVVAAGLAVSLDVKHPFSQSRHAADFVEETYTPAPLLVGHFDYATSPIGFHLGRPVFYPNQNQYGTFIYWSNVRFKRNIGDLILEAGTVCRERGPFVLLTNYPIFVDHTQGSALLSADGRAAFRLAASFSPAVVEEEAYWVYEVGCETN